MKTIVLHLVTLLSGGLMAGGILGFGSPPWVFIPPANNIRSATTKGTGSGTINVSDGLYVTVSSTSPNKIVTLPDPMVGLQLVIHNERDAYELRSTSPETISINGGRGIKAGSDIPRGSTVYLTCVTLTKWRAFALDGDGEISTVPPAAP